MQITPNGASIIERISAALCLLVVAGSAGYFTWDSHQTQVVTRQMLVGVTPVLTNAAGLLKAGTTTVTQVGNAAEAIGNLAPSAGSAIDRFGLMADNVSGVTVNLQRPCEEKNIKGSPFHTTFFSEDSTMPCGFLPDLTRTLATTRLTIGQFEQAGMKLNADMPVWEQQEVTLYDQTHNGMTDLQTYLKSKSIQDTVADIQRGIHYSADTTQNVAGISGSVDKMTTHLEKTVDAPVPAWKTLVPGAELIGKIYACLAYHVCVN